MTLPIMFLEKQCGSQKYGSVPGTSRNCRVNWISPSEGARDASHGPLKVQADPLIVVCAKV